MTKYYPTDYDRYLFHKGSHYRSYEVMGCHPCREQGRYGVRFNVWAPNARSVSVVGDFNEWQEDEHPMNRIDDSGIWTLFIPGLDSGDLYKYKIRGYGDYQRLKADPYAFYAELKPGTASRVFDLNGFNWQDGDWQQQQANYQPHEQPLNIYEVHLGSWRRNEEGRLLNYREIADKLVDYVSKMGYTHIELLPITEHPFDGSWGYQTTGYYAATSRYGNPHDFMYFIDRCHRHQLGVIIDWVPGHFCRDDHGLRLFDGTPLFESQDPRRAHNLQWDTLNFDFAQPEVWSFLISNALFWFDKFHIDGIRVDAVSNMLYLDYQKQHGQWAANKYGGNENLEAIDFLKKLNEEVFAHHPGALMIAEESTTWPRVTAPTDSGGLGFNFKWNMGWMNDTLEYMEKDPIYRKHKHNLLTFSLMYFYSENFILPLSHDEVVHGKKSLLDKMPGDYWQKFANLRLLYGYMLGHPGKNLLFMGGEFGQFIEWNYKQELDWHLLEYEKHRALQKYVEYVNHIYIKEEALWTQDHQPEGFQWVEANDAAQSVLSFLRYGGDSSNHILIIGNFTPVARQSYRVGVPARGHYREILNSNWPQFGGVDTGNNQISQENQEQLFQTETKQFHNQPYSISVDLPPLTVIYLKFQQNSSKEV